MNEARAWKCPKCGYSVELTYEELAECGFPMCVECDLDLELQDAMEESQPNFPRADVRAEAAAALCDDCIDDPCSCNKQGN